MVAAGAPRLDPSPASVIYIVDDDPLVRTSLERLLQLETPHEVKSFASADEALAAVRTRPPELLISDLTMPGVDGLELLRRVRAASPDTARVVLTGYADKDSAIRAINDAGIFQYVEKPWDNAQLLRTVAAAIEHVLLSRQLSSTIAELLARNQELERTLAELREAQERLIASERMAAVGRLASGIAHEIGNQLSLLGYAELVAEKYRDDPQTRELTDPLLAARRRLSSMVASIREYARGSTSQPYSRDRTSLVPVVDEALSILRFEPALKTRHVDRRPNDPATVANLSRERIVQVIINLVRNALQATREHGHIRIGVETRGDKAVIEVEDDGVGIDPANLERIWDPFFSTKGEMGTGLGLGICRRILSEHEGDIRVRSRPGEGAVFTVELPSAG